MEITTEKRGHEKDGGLATRVRELLGDERGTTATEYVVILVLVASFVVSAISMYGETLHLLWDMAVDTIYRDVRL